MKAMRVGARFDDESIFVLDEDNKIHCIKSNDITMQQQQGATMKVDRVIEIGGFAIALLLLF